jgi:hypothetical protein
MVVYQANTLALKHEAKQKAAEAETEHKRGAGPRNLHPPQPQVAHQQRILQKGIREEEEGEEREKEGPITAEMRRGRPIIPRVPAAAS